MIVYTLSILNLSIYQTNILFFLYLFQKYFLPFIKQSMKQNFIFVSQFCHFYLYHNWSIEITNFINLFFLLWIDLLFIAYLFPGENCFYIINHCCLLDYQMNPLYHLFIYWTKILNLLFSFNNPSLLIAKKLRVKNFIQKLLIIIYFIPTFYLKLL